MGKAYHKGSEKVLESSGTLPGIYNVPGSEETKTQNLKQWL